MVVWLRILNIIINDGTIRIYRLVKWRLNERLTPNLQVNSLGGRCNRMYYISPLPSIARLVGWLVTDVALL
jgi:hypothetical protein